MPFCWQGFYQSTRYTYYIDTNNILLQDLESQYKVDIRRRKAQHIGIKVYESEDVRELYRLIQMIFLRQHKNLPYNLNFLNTLYNTCKQHDCCKIFFANYKNNNIAAMLLVYDNKKIYYLIGGINSDYKDLGAMDMLLHEGIMFAC